MSHVTKLGLQIKDLEALRLACESLGLELVLNQKTYKWFGRSVGDYPLPEGMTADDLGKCDHVIRIPDNSSAYEIGVVQNGDHYELLWDFWAGGKGMVAKVSDGNGLNANKLKQYYAVHCSILDLQSQGYQVSQYETADGSLVIQGVGNA